MKTYMIWIPGKIIGVWTNPSEALKGFSTYISDNRRNLNVVKMTIYDKSYERGSQREYSLSGQELMELSNEDR